MTGPRLWVLAIILVVVVVCLVVAARTSAGHTAPPRRQTSEAPAASRQRSPAPPVPFSTRPAAQQPSPPRTIPHGDPTTAPETSDSRRAATGTGEADRVRTDIVRRTGRPVDPGVDRVITLWQSGQSMGELLECASRDIADPLQRVIMDGWIRDRCAGARAPSALGAGGAPAPHVSGIQAEY